MVLEGTVESSNGNGTKGGLTRDLICETALRLIDRSGLESLSMRALAAALGVKAGSIYYHFSSKEELLTGIAEFLFRKVGRLPDGDDWTDRVKGTFVQFRAFVQAHPNAAPLLLRDLPCSSVAKKRANVLLRILGRAGLDPIASSCLVSNLVALLVGHTLLAAWMQKEGIADATVQEQEATINREPDWVQEVFQSGVSDQSRLLAVKTGAAAGSEQLPDEAAYLAGLDALITGFRPD
jgi:AcrR family transcriptional regulator